MSKIQKIIRNLVILSIFLFVFMRVFTLSFSPLTAFEITERSLHYGPSEIVHMEEYDGGKLILGKYDKWVSCTPVEREFLFFWRVKNLSLGLEKDESQVINYNYGRVDETYYFHGIINDEDIDKIEVTLGNGEVYSETEFHEDLFLLTIESEYENSSRLDFREIKSYDAHGNVIFEYKLY